MITINSIKQIDELVAEQLGWQKTDVGYFHSDYPDYPRLPHFVDHTYWNQQLLNYLLTEEQCEVKYNLNPDRTEVSVNYVYSPDREFYRLEMKEQGQLALCLAFLSYKGIEFTLDKNIYNAFNNS